MQMKLLTTKNLVKIGILSALSFAVMRFLEIPLPLFPGFLKIDFGDVPAVLGALTIHPLAGVMIVIIKNLLGLASSTTGGIGEIANALVGISFVLPIGLCNSKHYGLRQFIIGCGIGILCMVIMGIVTNAYLTMPLYGEAACIKMGQSINPHITGKWTFLLYTIAPFNLLKGFLVTLVSVILVKGIQPLIKQLRLGSLK